MLWVLETDLELHQGGACLHCESRPPDLGASPGRIRLADLGHRRFVGVLTQPEALRGSSMLQAHRLDFD